MKQDVRGLLYALKNYSSFYQYKMEEYVSHNRRVLKPFKDVFTGRDVVLLATGPTHKIFKPIENAIYIGVNRAIYQSGIKLDYFFCSDYSPLVLLANQYRDLHKFYNINLIWSPQKIKKFDGVSNIYSLYTYLSDKFSFQYTNSPDLPQVYLDMPKSTIFSATLFALWGNAKRIFLVGCDGSFAHHRNHIYTEENVYGSLKEGWKFIKNLLKKNYHETEILSVNPVCLKGIFNELVQNDNALNAVVEWQRNNYNNALALINQALQEEPDNLKFINIKLGVLLDLGKFPEAEELAQTNLEANPEWSDGYLFLDKLLKKQGNVVRQQTTLEKGLAKRPDNIQLLVQYAFFLYDSGEAQALSVLLARHEILRHFLAEELFERTWYKPISSTSIEMLRKALQFSQEFPQIFYFLSNYLRQHNLYAEAEDLCFYAISAFENNAVFYMVLVWLEFIRNNTNKAALYLKKLFELEPLWDQTMHLVFDMLLRLNYKHEALALAGQIRKCNPNAEFLPCYLAKIYESLGDMPKALYFAEQAATKFPPALENKFVDGITTYARILNRLGLKEEAIKLLASYLSSNPNNIYIANYAINLFYEANAYLDLLGELKDLREYEPGIVFTQLTQVDILKRLLRTEESQDMVNNLIMEYGDKGDYYLELSRLNDK